MSFLLCYNFLGGKMNDIKIKAIYRHFKGGYYIIEGIGKDCETLEELVVYRGLYGDNSLWIRPKKEFFLEVDHEKYPNVKQKYKFELQDIPSVKNKF